MSIDAKQFSPAARRGKIKFLSLLIFTLFVGCALGIFLESARAEWCVTVTDAAAANRVGSQQCGFATQAAAEAFGSSIGISRSFYKITGSDSSSTGTGGVSPTGDAATQLGTAIGNEIHKALFGDPAAEAAAAAQAAQQAAIAAQQAAERQKLADAEAMRRLELAKQRILGALKGMESSDNLGLKMDSDQPLAVTTTTGAFGSTAVVPVVGGLALKMGDDSGSKVSSGDPMVVDARNVPSGLPKSVEEAIPHTPAGDCVRKGFQAIQAGNWDAALAWFQDARNHDPGDPGLTRLVDLARFTLDRSLSEPTAQPPVQDSKITPADNPPAKSVDFIARSAATQIAGRERAAAAFKKFTDEHGDHDIPARASATQRAYRGEGYSKEEIDAQEKKALLEWSKSHNSRDIPYIGGSTAAEEIILGGKG